MVHETGIAPGKRETRQVVEQERHVPHAQQRHGDRDDWLLVMLLRKLANEDENQRDQENEVLPAIPGRKLFRRGPDRPERGRNHCRAANHADVREDR